MKPIVQNIARSVAVAVFIALPVSCADEGQTGTTTGDEKNVSVHTRIVSQGGKSNNPSARLLFWREEVFHSSWMNASATAHPLYTVALEEDIDNYTYDSRIYYQTPYTYPYNGSTPQRLHATGYAPDNVLTPTENNGMRDYKSLDVAADKRDGSVDFLACDGSYAHSATGEEGETFLQEEHELDFRHLTAKLTFIGERDENMYGLVGVRKVQITVHNPQPTTLKSLVVPTRFEQYTEGEGTIGSRTDKSTYIVAEKAHFPDNSQLFFSPIIPAEGQVELGSFYVLTNNFEYGTSEGQFNPFGGTEETGAWVGTMPSGRPELSISVNAEIYNAESGSGSDAFVNGSWENVPVTWLDDFITGPMMLPGYEYKVIIHFDRVGIAIRAEAVPWNPEELHEYPFHPIHPATE